MTSEGQIEKIATYIEVSGGLLDDVQPLLPELLRMSRQTPQELAAVKREQEARRATIRTAVDARHADARTGVDALLWPVLDHHGPVVLDYGWGSPQCEGCDAGWNAEDSPEWPCSTWRLITGETA